MPLFNSIASWLMVKRMHQIELFMKYPHEVQEETFKKLIDSARDTEWGKKHGYKDIEFIATFKQRVPLQDYESLKGDIDRVRKGEQNILWPSEIKWFAKSSGTTSDKSKFLPVSQESLNDCHFRGGKDMVSIYCNNNPESQLFTGKNIALGGSHDTLTDGDHQSFYGDLSAIVMQNLPVWAELLRAPNLSIALMNEWEEKLDKMAAATMQQNITSIAGVPSWMLVLLNHVVKVSGKKNLAEVWPNLEVFFHGGISFKPYKESYKKIFEGLNINYLEIYNASEGFIGLQDQSNSDELLLMLDYGIYYEFIHVDENGVQGTNAIPLHEVELNKNYALVISTNAGLWRYQLGDTIMFTSLHPYRFRITGRTKHFINAFGEELIIDNAEKGLAIACEKTNAIVREYTAGPVFMNEGKAGAHEWIIEFEKEPDNLAYFTEVLDNALKTLNSDYEAKRYNSLTLQLPIIRKVPNGTFYNWLKSKNKLGGQHKVPRLSNDRKYIEEIISYL